MTQRLRRLTAACICLCLAAVVSPALADSLSGDLVVTNSATRQFRLVDRPGSYTAPAGTDLEALDGRRVEVELSSNGSVLSVVDAPKAVEPVVHGWSTVRGQVEAVDTINGTFTIRGDNQTYRAPGKDITPYIGKTVELKLDENERVVQIDLISSAVPVQPVQPIAAACDYRGQSYSGGAAVCQAGTQYRCDGTRWVSLGTTCVPPSGDTAAAASPRPCAVGGATVATGSSVCRDGMKSRCDDGLWINVGTACR